MIQIDWWCGCKHFIWNTRNVESSEFLSMKNVLKIHMEYIREEFRSQNKRYSVFNPCNTTIPYEAHLRWFWLHFDCCTSWYKCGRTKEKIFWNESMKTRYHTDSKTNQLKIIFEMEYIRLLIGPPIPLPQLPTFRSFLLVRRIANVSYNKPTKWVISKMDPFYLFIASCKLLSMKSFGFLHVLQI